MSVKRAMMVAEAAHKGQTRHDGSPYIAHPTRVFRRVQAYMEDDSELLQAALLHDVVEDSAVTVEDLKRQFGARVAQLVQELTKPDGVSKDDYIRTFAQADPAACLVKICDRLDNVLDSPKNPTRYSTQALLLLESIGANPRIKDASPKLQAAIVAASTLLSDEANRVLSA